MLTLTKTQKNDVLARVRGAGLDPRDFVWVEQSSPAWSGWNGYQADTLVHKPTGYYCAVFDPPAAVGAMHLSDASIPMLTAGPYVAAFEPTHNGPRGRLVGVSLNSVLTGIEVWLAVVKREHEAPDLWAELTATDAPLNVLILELDGPNAPFTQPERERLATSLDQIRDHLAALYDLTAEQIGVMNSGFAELRSASERLGKKDWKGILINWLLTIATTAGFTPEARQALFEVAGRGLRWLIEQGRLLGP
jgi:hypothetical protein